MLQRVARARFRRNRPAMLGLMMVLTLVLFAILGPLFLGDPNASDFSLRRDAYGAPPGPSPAHLLGTDPLFRDLLARLAAGARLSLVIAAGATALALGIGTLVGVAAGYCSGTRHQLVDTALMRLVDMALAFPFLLLITAIGVAVDRADAVTVLLILGLTGWCGVARLVRAKTMQLKRADFVVAATALGARAGRIISRHILPNLAGTLLIIGSHAMAQMILAEAVLSYLTVGIQPPAATWGRMLHEAESYLSLRLGLIAVPGFAIMIAVLGFTRVGDGLRDALAPQPDGSRGSRVPGDLLIAAAALLLVMLATPNELPPPIGRPEKPTDPLTRGGTFRLATLTNLRHLEPALAYSEGTKPITGLIFATLVRFNAAGRITGDLARDRRVSDGGRRHTFVLKRGLRFHDGAPLLAADVKRSLERTLHPSTPCPAASLYGIIRGYSDFRAGRTPHLAGVQVLDDHTVRFELDSPDATFLPLLTLSFAAPVCPSSGERVDAREPTPPCGAGPFRLAAWRKGERVSLRRFEHYHEPGKPYLDGIEWYLDVPAHSQRYRFELGELDYVHDVSGADIALFQADRRWSRRVRWSTKHVTNGIFLNTELAPFDRRHVRRAIALAIDSSVLAKVKPSIAPTDRMLPESIPGPSRQMPMRRHDLAAALQEMAQAGFGYDPATGAGGYPAEVRYLTVPDTFEQSAAEIFQQQLARIGLRIRLELASYASWSAQISKRRTVPMGWYGWGADFPDPSNFFQPILTTGAIQDEGSQNVSFFSNAELDDVVVRARLEQDHDKRLRLYQRAEEIVRDEAPWIPVYGSRAFEIWHPYVRGYEPHPIVPQRFDDLWLRRDPGHRRLGALGPLGFGREG